MADVEIKETMENGPGADLTDEEKVKAEALLESQEGLVFQEQTPEESDLTDEEQSFLDDIRAMQTGEPIKRLSKTAWKKLNAEGRVVTATGEASQADTETKMLKDDMLEVAASITAGKILVGKLEGIQQIPSNKNIPQYFGVVGFGHGTLRVFIPSYALLVHKTGEILDNKVQQEVERKINSMLGAEIRFIAKAMDKSKRTVYGDRLAALQADGRRNYLKPLADGSPRVIPGMLVEAKIMRVDNHSVSVNILGSDTTIKATPEANEVSWNYVNNCRQLYRAGETVVVKVLSIDVVKVKMNEKEYSLVKTTASIRQASKDPMERAWPTIAEDGRYLVEVTGVVDAGVFVNLPGGVNCLCAFPKIGEKPEVGDTRVVRVTEKKINPETGKKSIFGIFVRT